MKKGIFISLLALSLAACGGDSSNESGKSINKDFSSGIQGSSIEPTLTTFTVSDGDTVSLNTTLTGSVVEDGKVRLSFTPTEAKTVALVLSSTIKDLGLAVSYTGKSLDSSGDNSNEALVFEVLANQQYSIKIESYEGSGDFQLKLVDANRSSLGLSKNEHIIIATYNQTQVCIEDGKTDNATSTHLVNTTINWKEGYLVDLSGEGKTSFTSVQGDSFTVKKSISKTNEGEKASSDLTLNYTTNFETGALTGQLVSKFTHTDKEGKTEVCDVNSQIAAKVVL